MFREGVKELTDKIDKGKISPAAASAQLQAEGVIVSARTLEEKSRMAPGESPVWQHHQRPIRRASAERAARRCDGLSPTSTPDPPTGPSAPPTRPDRTALMEAPHTPLAGPMPLAL